MASYFHNSVSFMIYKIIISPEEAGRLEFFTSTQNYITLSLSLDDIFCISSSESLRIFPRIYVHPFIFKMALDGSVHVIKSLKCSVHDPMIVISNTSQILSGLSVWVGGAKNIHFVIQTVLYH